MELRRRATREELAQGEEEMKQAEARLKAEEAIEDRKSEPKREVVGKLEDHSNLQNLL